MNRTDTPTADAGEVRPPPPYLAMFSVHGLIRGRNLELGRDADTGGQTKYVLELAQALARRPEFEGIDLITRRIDDPQVDGAYDVEFEHLDPQGARPHRPSPLRRSALPP